MRENLNVRGCRRFGKISMRPLAWQRSRRACHSMPGGPAKQAHRLDELLAEWEAAKRECDKVRLMFTNALHAYITGSGAAPSAKLLRNFVSAHAAARQRLAALYDALWRMRAAIPLL